MRDARYPTHVTNDRPMHPEDAVLAAEREAAARIISDLLDATTLLWTKGDGGGGIVLAALLDQARDRGWHTPRWRP